MSLFKAKKQTIFNKGVNSSLDAEFIAPRNHGENTEIKNKYVLNNDLLDNDVIDNDLLDHDAEFKGEENYDQYIQNMDDSSKSINYSAIVEDKKLIGAKILADDDVDNSFIKFNEEKNIEEKLECYKNNLFIKTIKEIKNNDITNDNNNELKLSKSGEILKKYLSYEDCVEHHIYVYNNWVTNRIKKTITDRIIALSNNRELSFENLIFKEDEILTPQYARENGLTYGRDWYVDIVLTDKNLPRDNLNYIQKHTIKIGRIPTMLKTIHCKLRDKNDEQLIALGEDPKDPGGYFIVSGVEKVVLLQEMLILNKIYIMDIDEGRQPLVRINSSTARGTPITDLGLKRKEPKTMKIRFSSLRSKKDKNDKKYRSVNVLRIFGYYGFNDINVIKSKIRQFIRPEIADKAMLKLSLTIVDYIATNKNDVKVIYDKMNLPDNDNEIEMRKEVDKLLDTDLFQHIGMVILDGDKDEDVKNRIKDNKLNLLSIMIAQFLEHLAGFRPLSDRDSWSNKRIEGGGRMMESLFRNAWRNILNRLKGELDVNNLFKNYTFKTITDIIPDIFRDSFITSNWGIKGKQVKNNVAQTLYRDNIIATYAHINTVDVGISRTDRQQKLRMVQNTQWGFIDPVSTPEGETVGIIKNLSLTARVSIEQSDDIIIRSLLNNTQFNEKIVINNEFFAFSDETIFNLEQVKELINEEQTFDFMDKLELNDKILGWCDSEKFKTYFINNKYIKFIYSDNTILNDKLMVNGKFLGWCNGQYTNKYLLYERRRGCFPNDMSIIKEHDWLYVDISASRLIRPVLIVDEITQNLIFDNNDSIGKTPHEWLSSGAMEYISAWEQEYVKIAPTKEDIQKRNEIIEGWSKDFLDLLSVFDIKFTDNDRKLYDLLLKKFNIYKLSSNHLIAILNEISKLLNNDDNININIILLIKNLKSNRPYTHCEIDPQVILGIASSLIPWPDHNQAPRNTYQVSMGKQALGIYHSNHQERFDGTVKVLALANRPLVETEMYKMIGLDERGQGENVTVAFMAFPYTEEDAFIFKKEFLDNGGFRIYKYFTYKTICRTGEELKKSSSKKDDPLYKYIESNGLPKIGSPLKSGDCVISKFINPDKSTEINESVFLRIGETGIVDKVLVSTDSKNTTVTVKLRVMRIPQEGDKFAPRNAQKGTIGLVMSDIDMPFTSNGIVPDIIINPHCIPSRMTMSYPMELLASKHAAMRATRINGSAFKPFEINTYKETLNQYNMDEYGYEKMLSGTSGEYLGTETADGTPLPNDIYMGPVYFQALKHHVQDKIQARGTGFVRPMTRQPLKGRGNRGGLRFGEMERDAAISHGASAFLRERLMLVSDKYETVFCKNCGIFARHLENENVYTCDLCPNKSFGKCIIPYAYKYLIHLLGGIGINLCPEFISSDEYADKIFNSSKYLPNNNDDLNLLTEYIADKSTDNEINDNYDNDFYTEND
jgi:DNA-directed RNA polymerase beta subunit